MRPIKIRFAMRKNFVEDEISNLKWMEYFQKSLKNYIGQICPKP